MKKNREKKESRVRRSGRLLSAAGTVLIVLVILFCSLLILPKMFGCHMYHVLSGSMEPELPVGSLICVRADGPEEVAEDDIIAFYGSLEDSGIITHRVIKNNVVSGTFRTKGDANEKEDPLPVPYDNYIGNVIFSIPYMGRVLTWMTSFYGKLTAAGVILLGAVFNLAASLLDRK
ncbi:MAG: signal peptidase I [Lachnospiraceae bacterium]|jgi:signal peptidase|nr:signal peptidase I [Lachnospiraceae bacterium]